MGVESSSFALDWQILSHMASGPLDLPFLLFPPDLHINGSFKSFRTRIKHLDPWKPFLEGKNSPDPISLHCWLNLCLNLQHLPVWTSLLVCILIHFLSISLYCPGDLVRTGACLLPGCIQGGYHIPDSWEVLRPVCWMGINGFSLTFSRSLWGAQGFREKDSGDGGGGEKSLQPGYKFKRVQKKKKKPQESR